MIFQRIVLGYILSIALLASWAVVPRQDVIQHLMAASVTIDTPSSEGSGFVVQRNGHTFVWTCAHVIDDDGAPSTDISVVRFTVRNGKTVGYVRSRALVLKWNRDADLALLWIPHVDFHVESVKFSDSRPQDIGKPICHVGSVSGLSCSNSYTTGIISQHGRQNSKYLLVDQCQLGATHGCSGGGVFLMNGQCIGMVRSGEEPGVAVFFTPVRQMRAWAARNDALWAIDE